MKLDLLDACTIALNYTIKDLDLGHFQTKGTDLNRMLIHLLANCTPEQKDHAIDEACLLLLETGHNHVKAKDFYYDRIDALEKKYKKLRIRNFVNSFPSNRKSKVIDRRLVATPLQDHKLN